VKTTLLRTSIEDEPTTISPTSVSDGLPSIAYRASLWLFTVCKDQGEKEGETGLRSVDTYAVYVGIVAVRAYGRTPLTISGIYTSCTYTRSSCQERQLFNGINPTHLSKRARVGRSPNVLHR